MSGHDELKRALRQANAELDVPHPNWTAILTRARRRLALRVGGVVALALAGSLLLLGGGLNAAGVVPLAFDRSSKKVECKKGERLVGNHCEKVRRCRKRGGGQRCEGHGSQRCREAGRKSCQNAGGGGQGGNGGHPRKKPNLTVSLSGTEVSVTDDSSIGTGEFEVTVTTEREGEPPSSRSRAVQSLGPHETRHLDTGCVAGDHLVVKVDSGKRIDESSEKDNMVAGECQPEEKANLVAAVDAGEIVVENSSSVDAGPFEVRVTVELVEGESTEAPAVFEVQALPAGETWRHDLPCGSGDLVTIEVDASKQVDESNEEDNTIEREKCPADETKPDETPSPEPTPPSTTPEAKSPSETTSPSTEPTG